MQRKIGHHNKLERNKKSFSSSFRAPKKEKNYKSLIILVILSIIVISIILFLVLSSFLKIKNTEIKGLNNEKMFEIESMVENQKNTRKMLFKQENLIFFNQSDLINSLNSFNFHEVKVKKDYFSRKITINIKEREKSIIFLESSDYFFIDKDANIIESIKSCEYLEKIKEQEASSATSSNNSVQEDAQGLNIESEQDLEQEQSLEQEECLKIDQEFKSNNLLPLIENNGKNRLDSNKKIIKLEPGYIDFSLKLYNDLSENSDFGFKNIILDEEYNTVKVRLNNDLELYFSFKNDYLDQISRFFTLKRERINDLKGKKYIDFRYGDKIYYY